MDVESILVQLLACSTLDTAQKLHFYESMDASAYVIVMNISKEL